MALTSQYDYVIFDCDGVILDSNIMKSNAFSLALSKEDPLLVEQFILYHKANGGVSRYIKFEYFFKNIKKEKKYKKELDYVLEQYAKLSYQGLLGCDEVPGIRNILKKITALGIPCYVISGGDQNEVRKVLEKRNLSCFFKGIFGSPISKIDHMMALEEVKNSNHLGAYFGDAKIDYDVAKKCKLDFFFVAGVSEWKNSKHFCHMNGVPIIKNFEDDCLNILI